MKTWLFWDQWHIEHQDNVQLCQSKPKWIPDATYQDPTFDYLGFWPTVWLDEDSGQWRMLYFGSGVPLTLLAAESSDGIDWKPMDLPDIKPDGEKYAPNHIFSLEGANGGPVYIDPVAKDGKKFKFCCVQRGGVLAERARYDENSPFHEFVIGKGAKPWMAENLFFTSPDGINWQVEASASCTAPQWHPDPPMPCFYNEKTGIHTMVTRPGWGDRRIATIASTDALNFSDLRCTLQPDHFDPPQMQFYGMPVIPYQDNFVGFLWTAHFSNAENLGRFNQLNGYIDNQLTYSFDGVHFQRGMRNSFIENNEPGQPGSGIIYPTCMVETDNELRIYSAATSELHMQETMNQFTKKGQAAPSYVIMHTLRKEGFMYLASKGNWATLSTKPMILFEPELYINALAPYGQVQFQLCDIKSEPIAGYTFADCVCFSRDDSLNKKIHWKNKNLSELTNKVIRLQMKFRNARIYALKGSFHFADAMDVALLDDGRKINTSLFDF